MAEQRPDNIERQEQPHHPPAVKPISNTAFYCCGIRMRDAETPHPICGDRFAKLDERSRYGDLQPFHGRARPEREQRVTKTSSRTRPSARSSADISGIRSPRLCFGCAWQAGGLRVEGGRQAAAKLAVVSHDQAVGKSALAILPVEKCLLHCSLVLER